MISGDVMFDALKNTEMIIMACNTRITKGVVKGIMRAAKKDDAAVIFELAKSESDLEGGYTGLKPAEFCSRVTQVAQEVGHDIAVLHADHITVQKGTPEEVDDVKKLIKAQIDAGYQSYAVDASYLFNLTGKTLEEELALNVKVTTELVNYIQDNMDGPFGLEVEVGEIGRKDTSGMVLTQPEEAVSFISTLKKNGIAPHLLATANGSAHGNTFDASGKLIEQVSIDIAQTIKVGEALEKFDVHIAQHGITGTPVKIIKEHFPKKYLRKGNVGTHWMNLVWKVLEKEEPELYKKIWDWTLKNHSKPGKSDAEVFGKSSKLAIKVFFEEIDNVKESTTKIIEENAYKEARIFFDAFNAQGSAAIVRKKMN